MAVFGKFSGANETIGIDIGSHAIKVVQIAATRNGYLLTRAGSTLTPPEAVKQGVIDDRVAVAEAIRTLLDTLGIRASLAVAAVAGPSVVVRQVQLPAMPEGQLRKSIYWEARNYISFPVEDCLLDFQILGTQAGDGTPKMDVMLVATPRALVDSRVEALEQAGLEPIAVELESFALMRLTVDLISHLLHQEDTWALVDIGRASTQISLVSAGTFILSRSVAIAGDSLTGAIAAALGVDNTHADAVKERETEVLLDENARALLPPVGQQASRALEPVLEQLVREIRRSFAFFDYQQQPGVPRQGVNRIILSGGSAKLTGLAPYLSEQLSVPVEPVDFTKGGRIMLPDGADELYPQMPLLATATGLALREPMLAHEKEAYR